jgi:threonine synthase
MGYEMVEQLGWRTPDVIVYPTGGGVGIIGIYKALLELRELGWVTGELPRLVAVQAAGCRPIVDAFATGADESVLVEGTHTIAFGLNVPKALGDFLVLRAVRATNGTAIAVTDEEIVAAQSRLASTEGAFICPEGAACIAAVQQLRDGGWLRGADEVIVLNTGMGLKYPQTFDVHVPVLEREGRVP